MCSSVSVVLCYNGKIHLLQSYVKDSNREIWICLSTTENGRDKSSLQKMLDKSSFKKMFIVVSKNHPQSADSKIKMNYYKNHQDSNERIHSNKHYIKNLVISNFQIRLFCSAVVFIRKSTHTCEKCVKMNRK